MEEEKELKKEIERLKETLKEISELLDSNVSCEEKLSKTRKLIICANL